jgi:predicted negative regulator of RcsB-dependent stress response
MMAAMAVGNGEVERALQELDWALGATDEVDNIVRVATLRKAMLLSQQGSADAAISLLENADAGTYEVQYQELLGDLHANNGRPAEAFAAYDRALQLGGGEQLRPLLKMKRDDLAGAES